MNNLKKQLKNPNHKEYAKDCIKIYEWLKETDPENKVWESRWNPLVNVNWERTYPKSIPIHKPNILGYTLLKGIKNSK